jgi:hypothetical protein
MALVILMLISNISFSMALSTFFTDAKVANYVGSLLMNFPIFWFLNIIQFTGGSRNWLYVFNWLPIIPACSILTQLTSVSPASLPISMIVIRTEWIVMPVQWLFLILNIPFWFIVYLYLDNVMPNTYGVQKHWLYFLKDDYVPQ